MPEVFSISKAIIIPTHEKFSHWLDNCLRTLKGCDYKIEIVVNTDSSNKFEMAAIEFGMRHYDEFIVLQDTIEVKDLSIFDKMFEIEGPVFLNPHGQMFINKYVTKVLENITLPKVFDKRSAVNAETLLHQAIKQQTFVRVLDPSFVDGPAREEKFGRTNMVIENEWLKKYKACFSLEGIKEYERQLKR